MQKTQYFDMVVIGGGTTGTAVARDLALRNFGRVLLVDKEDLAAGTSGRCHSNLHGGGRYIVNDIETARESCHENRILREIAPHTIDPTNGLFIAVDDEGLEYTETFVANADSIGMYYKDIDPKEAMAREPFISRNVLRALETEDAGFDPFRLSASQATDAVRHGAEVWGHHEAVRIVVSGGAVSGVDLRNNLTGEITQVSTGYVVNAAGPWAGKVCATAEIDIPMKPDKGTMAVYNFRLARPMVHMLRMPTDGDGLVSMGYQNTTILGTTSGELVEPDQAVPTMEEVLRMEEKVTPGFPLIRRAKRLRIFCGVRPLCQAGPSTGREISRRLILIDHKEVNGVQGLLTITGGKYTTARLMAEVTVDRVCKHLGVVRECTTHLKKLPGAETREQVERDGRSMARTWALPFTVTHKLAARYGEDSEDILRTYPDHTYPVCHCNQITASEVIHAMESQWALTLDDIRRRTRTGMSSCQGTYCTPQIAALYWRTLNKTTGEARQEIIDFLQERWKGMYPVAIQGDMMNQAALVQALYSSSANLRRSSFDRATPEDPREKSRATNE